MSNRLFQGIIHQMRDSIDRVIGVIDDTAHVVACSDLSKLDSSREYLALDLSEGRVIIRDGYTYKPLDAAQHPEFAVFVEGTDDMAARYAGILAVSISGIKQYYKPEEMVGKRVVVVSNLAPRKIRGIESRGMLLCAVSGEGDDEKLCLVRPEKDMDGGSEVC